MKKILIVIVILLLLTGCNKKKLDKENEITDNDLKSEVLLENEGLQLKIDKFSYEDNYTTVNIIVTNNNDYDIYIESYEVYVYDKNNTLLGKLVPKFDSIIEKKEKTNHMFGAEINLSNAHHIDYKFINIKKL